MLGKEIGHEIGQQTGIRVITDDQRGQVLEVTAQAEGTLLGVHYQDITTYVSWFEPNGTLRGTGQGVVMGENGEMGTYEATGVGTLNADGSTRFRGIILYRSETPKLAELAGKCCVFEYDTDPGGKSEGRFFLWE
jgi:hypothetical protein